MSAQSQKFEPLTPDDDRRLTQQRAVIERYLGDDEMSRSNYTKPAGKIGLLRAILEAGIFDASQTYELQCMGIIFGDALVQECGWIWRMVTDEFGRDPCVKVPGSSMVVFPLTIISKRIERGEEFDVITLFNIVASDTEERAQTATPLAD